MKYLVLSQLLTRAKKAQNLLNEETIHITDYYFKFIVTDQIIVLIRKAILGT